MAPLTVAQQWALAILPFPSALLSVAGSSTILFVIYHRRSTAGGILMGTRRRILVAMSVFDIFYSTSLALHPFLLPQNHPSPTKTYTFAFGNENTCRAMGTSYQIGLGAALYYVMLSFYYLLTVRYKVREQWVARYLEPFMHILAIGFPLGTGLTGAALNMWDVQDLMPLCWIGKYPKDCQDNPETCQGELLGYLFGASVYILLVLALAINNSLIYLHVRRIYLKHKTFTTFDDQHPNDKSWSQHYYFMDKISETLGLKRHIQQQQQQPKTESETSNVTAALSSHHNNSSHHHHHHTGALDGGTAHRKRTRAVATQGILYMCTGVFVYTPMFALQMADTNGVRGTEMGSVFWLLILQAIINPLSGCLNALIFFRPRYLALRGKHSNNDSDNNNNNNQTISRLEAVRMSILGHSSPPTTTNNGMDNNNGRARRSGLVRMGTGFSGNYIPSSAMDAEEEEEEDSQNNVEFATGSIVLEVEEEHSDKEVASDENRSYENGTQVENIEVKCQECESSRGGTAVEEVRSETNGKDEQIDDDCV